MESPSSLSILTFYWLSHLGIYSSLVSHLLSHLHIYLFLVFDLVLSFPFLFVFKFIPIFLLMSHCIFIFSQSLSISLCLLFTSVRMLEAVCTCLPARGCVCACVRVHPSRGQASGGCNFMILHQRAQNRCKARYEIFS